MSEKILEFLENEPYGVQVLAVIIFTSDKNPHKEGCKIKRAEWAMSEAKRIIRDLGGALE